MSSSTQSIVFLSAMRCHQFEVAAELELRGVNCKVITAFPHWKLKSERISKNRIKTFPWVLVPKLAIGRYVHLPESLMMPIEVLHHRSLDRFAAKQIEGCSVLESLSSFNYTVGQRVQKNGGKFIVHRGSAHVKYQYQLLHDEFVRWGLKPLSKPQFFIEQECFEYETSDLINVPSQYVKNTFIAEGVDPKKIVMMPYSAEPSKFYSVATPNPDEFNVIFVGQISLRKGIPYLLQAFAKLKHPKKKLWLVGQMMPDVKQILSTLPTENVLFLGRKSHSELREFMSSAHAFVLPSIDDGFGRVLTEALACSCPVICSENTGAFGFIAHGKEGFVVPIRSPENITQSLQQLADDKQLLETMRHNALQKIQIMRGWGAYTEEFLALCNQLTTNNKQELSHGN